MADTNIKYDPAWSDGPSVRKVNLSNQTSLGGNEFYASILVNEAGAEIALATSTLQTTANGILTTMDVDTGNIAVSVASIDAKTPALGQALAAGSVPVVLTADQLTTLTPPAAITGFATATNQTAVQTPTAPGTATATNGVLLAGYYNSGVVTYTNGQQGALRVGANGSLLVATGDDQFTATVKQSTAAQLNATVVGTGTFAVQAAQTGTWNVGTVTTVSTVTNLSQMGGAAIAMGTGVRSAGTQRVTIATDDIVPITNSNLESIDSNIQLITPDIDAIASTVATDGSFRTVIGIGGYNGSTISALLLNSNNHVITQLAGANGTAIGVGAGTAAAALRVTQASDSPAATAANQTTQITHAATIAGAVKTDDAAFTPAIDKVITSGFVYDDTTPDTVNEGDVGYARMSAGRELYTVIRDASGNERGATVDASGQLYVTSLTFISDNSTIERVVPIAALDEVSGNGKGVRCTTSRELKVCPSFDGTKTSVGNGVSGTGVQRVTIASDSTGQVTLAAGTNAIGKLAANSGVDIGDVDVTSLPALAAGTNLIGRVSSSDETSTVYNGTTALTPKFAKIAASTSGNNTIVAAVTSKKIRVLAYNFIGNGAVNAKFQDGAGGTDLTGLKYIAAAGGGICAPYNPVGWFETSATTLLNLNLSAAIAVGGEIVYVEV